MEFTWIDWLIVGILALSTIISLIRGFTREVLSLATWIIAVWVAIRFTPALDTWIGESITSPELRMATAFLSIFLLVLIVGTLVSFLISKIINGTGLTGTDRLLGSIFGIARGALVTVLLIVIGGLTPVINDPAWEGSLLLPTFDPLTQKLLEYIPKDATVAWLQKENTQETATTTEGQQTAKKENPLANMPLATPNPSSIAPIPMPPTTTPVAPENIPPAATQPPMAPANTQIVP